MHPSAQYHIHTAFFFVALSLLFFTSACSQATSPQETITPFDGAPQITIASPLEGDTYQAGVGVNILLRIDNAGEDIARVAIEVDETIIGEIAMPNENGDASFTVSSGWIANGDGAHTISAVASRSDGSRSDASVTINVLAIQSDAESQTADDPDNAQDTTVQVIPTLEATAVLPQATDSAPQAVDTKAAPPTDAPTQAPAATNTSAPTNTPARPQVRITQGANVRSGPDTAFAPPIGSLAAGTTSDILAVNPSRTWYKIRYYNGDGWVSSLVAEVVGDLSGIPVEVGPPTPIAVTATPIPTATPSTAPDLIIDAAQSNFAPAFSCGNTTQINITVVNRGSAPSAGTNIVIEDIQPNGSVGETTQTVVGALQPNQNATAVAQLTVSTFVLEKHTLRVRVDGNNSVAESDENNNTWQIDYVLDRSSTCP